MRGMKPCVDSRVPLITACGGGFPLMRSLWGNAFMRARQVPYTLPLSSHSARMRAASSAEKSLLSAR